MRELLAKPFHKVARQLDRVGWRIAEAPERKRKKALIEAEYIKRIEAEQKAALPHIDGEEASDG